MQRSSPSIGSLAAALAKAQPELINPEKSLSATIRPEAAGGAEQNFRYAPLSSGLEIVRKTLGLHEIATMQTTSIDQAAGTVKPRLANRTAYPAVTSNPVTMPCLVAFLTQRLTSWSGSVRLRDDLVALQ